MRRATLLLTLFALSSADLRAEFRLHPMLSDGAVIQRERPITVKGWWTPGESLVVIAGGEEYPIEVDSTGAWCGQLKPMAATSTPFAIEFRTTSGELLATQSDLLVGDVWLCSGQSNMRFELGRVVGGPELAEAAGDPLLRLFWMEAAAAGSPLDSPRDGSWGRDTPENAQRFSAVGYEFGRELRATQDVPIGLIHASFGGTPVEGWLSPHAHASDPRLEYSRTQVAALMADHPDLYSNYDEHHQAAFEAFEQAREEWRARQRRGESNQGRRRQGQPGFEPGGKHLPSVLYNAMIHPFTPFAIRGVIWYQGEANTNYNREHYAGTMTALVEDWRRQWNQPDLPFLMVQLANIRAPQEAPGQRSHWAALRQAQLQVTRMAAGVRLATAIDLGDPDDLHPRNKLPLGRRLSLLARAYVYGEDALVSNGPIASQVVRDGDDLVIRFDSVGSGLRLMEGQTDVRGFELEIRPGSWVFVPGRITDTAEVRLSIPPGASAESVRYGWADNPILSLTNETGIPALPFELKLLY